MLYVLKYTGIAYFTKIFNLDSEGNIPTWFSSFLLLFSSLLLFLISVNLKKNSTKNSLYWKGLSFIFLYLAIDEAAHIHELTIKPLRLLLDVGGYFHFAWVIPGLIIVLAIVLIYIKFYINLPSKIRLLMGVAAVLYVGGAIGIEIIGGRYVTLYGMNMTFAVITTFEETFEMLGSSIFIYTLLLYVRNNLNDFSVAIND